MFFDLEIEVDLLCILVVFVCGCSVVIVIYSEVVMCWVDMWLILIVGGVWYVLELLV